MTTRKLTLYTLTFGRIPLVLLFLVINLAADTRRSLPLFLIALGLLIVAALTDLFDGYLARRWNLTSRFGSYADPLTDKVYYLVTLPALVYLAGTHGQVFHAQLLLALTAIFLLRDQWVSFLRSIGALHGVEAKANWSGKARTIISFPAICLIYNHIQAPDGWPLRFPASGIYALEIVCLAITLISGWVYTSHYWPSIRKESSR